MTYRENTEAKDLFGIEEALAKISLELLDPERKKLLTVTDVTPDEIFGMAVLMAFQKRFKSNMVKEWIENFLLLRVSRVRLGRREFVMMGSGLRDYSDERGRKKGVRDLFAGFR